jgi:uroporphyrinogen decarboxylase
VSIFNSTNSRTGQIRKIFAFRDKRLDPRDPVRVPAGERLAAFKESAAGRDYPLGIGVGSLFGWIRDWMGFENVSYAIMDDPKWVKEMIDHLGMLIYTTVEKVVKEVQFDYAAGWEDMCFNHGPILQPKYFEEWMCPNYRRISDLLKANGCDVYIVDCDGNINSLVPHWLDAGVNCMFPLEVRGGTDPVALREKYGHRVLLAGGVDKTQLIAGKEAIEKEILRLKPVVDDGGYIPHVDHRCPPDVTYENYLYYLKFKRETYGIPEPEPWEVRERRITEAKA